MGTRDVLVKDNDESALGAAKIRAILAPGHSRGSICYQVGHMLFSGDVLFYRNTGRVDLPGGGGRDTLTESIDRLYSMLPDETIVHPGHGYPTDIGSEKRENPRVSKHGGEWRK
jgi:hydroxyacylglutathione hydrolase